MSASVSSIRVVPAAAPTTGGVGKYRYIAMLAEGGMADVYLAVTQNAGFEKLVVIKQLRESLAEDPTFVAMFMDEARLAARLNHPNVVQTLEVGTDYSRPNPVHFIAMEFLEGVAYVRFARLKDRVPAPLAFHLRILIDVLRGLHYAHELCDFDGKPLSVVHRDVSPQNVMLTFAGGVKVLDFGIAKAELAAEQRPEDFKGKLEYMAPEQALRRDVDRRADVFSVGVMLFEALARRRLYRKGEAKHDLLVSGRLPTVLDVAPTSPKRLASICVKAMAFDRDDRYATADGMADDIEDWLGSTTQHVSARDVGSFVAEKFASTRAKISAAVEAQLALFRALPETAPDTLPISRIPVTDLPPEISEPPPPVSVPPAMLPTFPTSEPSLPEYSRVSGPLPAAQAFGPAGGPPPLLPLPSVGTADIPTITARAMPRGPAPGRQALAAAITLAVILLGGGGVYLFRGKLKRSPAHEPAPPTTSVSTASPTIPSSHPTTAPPPDAQVELTIKASPPEARISIDGAPATGNPATATRPRDGAIHLIRIEAPGYEPREESVGFDRSVYVNVDLHPSGGTNDSAPSSPSGKGGKKPAPKAPHPRWSAAKNIDSENPY